MRFIVWLFVLLLSLKSFGQGSMVSFTISQAIPYCGGAAPTAEMVTESEVMRPYANKTLYVCTKKGRCIKQITSNANGVFITSLKSGSYFLFESWKALKKGPFGDTLIDYDLTCLKAEWKKPDVIILLNKSKTAIENKIPSTALCFWQYPCALHKEMPPVTRPH